MKKRGVTIIELVVAMGIFAIITTLVVGAFVTVSRMKALTRTMRESQQKLRIASEMVTRLSRQADKAEIIDASRTLNLFFNNGATYSGTQFKMVTSDPMGIKYDLIMSDCVPAATPTCSSGWINPTKLLGDEVYLLGSSNFTKDTAMPSVLTIALNGKIGELTGNPYYTDAFNIQTAVVLENAK